MLSGEVTAFDERRGDGWLRIEDGTTVYFHCVEIAYGTRYIAVGAKVEAQRLLGHLGADEAASVRVVS